MRLLTHNLLICNRKNCREGSHALRVVVDKSEIRETPFRKEVVAKLVEKLDWGYLHRTVTALGEKTFPPEATREMLEDEEFLRKLHRIVYDTHILEGKLVCGFCQREYPVVKGIPNMILDESEV